jgi:molecular chaperone DnaK
MVRIGIDLGTTNSAVARVIGNNAEIIKIDGKPTTPSVIEFCDDGGIVFGYEAKDSLVNAAGDCASVFKRFMGHKEGEHKFILSESCSYTPTQLSKLLLGYLKEKTEETIGESVVDAVISVPAYFEDPQKRATRDAAEAAGFRVKCLIEEPVAAAIAYGTEHWRKNAVIMVYDLGGGTFDVSIIKQGANGNLDVIATKGNRLLGGKNWDDSLYDVIRQKVLAITGVDADDDGVVAQVIKGVVEKTKINLSQVSSTTIPISKLGITGYRDKQIEVSRQEFDELTSGLLKQTEECCEEALREKGLWWDDLTDVLLVGGSTRMPQVKEMIHQKINKTPIEHANPDESIALGAALRWLLSDPEFEEVDIARIKKGTSADVVPFEIGPVGPDTGGQDVTELKSIKTKKTHSLGVVSVNLEGTEYINDIIIPAGQTMPAKTAKAFRFFASPSNDTLEIFVLQGDGKPLSCEFIAKYIVRGIRHNPKGTKIRIMYSCDQNGIDRVQVRQEDDAVDVPQSNITRISGDEITGEEKRRFGEPVPKQIAADQKNVLFVIDTSGSMYGTPLKNVATAMKKEVGELSAELSAGTTRVGLMAFEYGPQMVLDPTSDYGMFVRYCDESTLTNYGVGGSHPLDGIYKALSGCQGRKIAIIMTDGEWFCDESIAEQAANQCSNAGIDIHAIGFGDAKQSFLQRISKKTQMGRGSDVVSSALGSIFQSIGQATGGKRSRQTDKNDESYCDTWDVDETIR